MNCPLCQTTSDYLTQAAAREYRYCPECRLISVPPRFHVSPEEEKERYLEHENSLDNEGYVQMFQRKIDLIQEHCPDLKTALDYGCGYAPVLKTLLERQGYRADRYDPIFFPHRETSQACDLIVSTETFEHFKNPAGELDTIAEWLQPRGYLAVMTQFYPARDGRPDVPAFGDWYYQRDPTHISFYNTETFEWIAHHHKFDMIMNNRKDFVILQRNPSM